MQDPYATPTTPNVIANTLHGGVPSEVIEMLRRTKGWVRFLAVLGFVGTALILLGSLGISWDVGCRIKEWVRRDECCDWYRLLFHGRNLFLRSL